MLLCNLAGKIGNYLPLRSKLTEKLERKIKVSAVRYLNTKPLLYGIEHHAVARQIILNLEYPALIAQDLRTDQTDVGLVPVAAIPTIPHAHIISDYGIAADGPVASVCLYSEVPVEELEQVYLDYQSRTSVKLVQVLLAHYWKKKVTYLDAPLDYIHKIKGRTGGVIIGDRALEQLPRFPYVYDLSACWKEFTGLPFVFAAWVANKPLPQDFIQAFNEANASGLQHIDEVVAATSYPVYDLQTYYRKNIHYHLDADKKMGLARFLTYIEVPERTS